MPQPPREWGLRLAKLKPEIVQSSTFGWVSTKSECAKGLRISGWQGRPNHEASQFQPGKRRMKELLEAIAKALVNNPDQVQVRSVEGEQITVLELRVHPSDLGRLIGRQGRMAESIRTILAAAGMKLRKRVTVEILD